MLIFRANNLFFFQISSASLYELINNKALNKHSAEVTVVFTYIIVIKKLFLMAFQI